MLFLCHVFNSGMNMLYYVIMGLFVVIQILIVQYGGGLFEDPQKFGDDNAFYREIWDKKAGY